jgi:hypothetical protein
MPHLEPTYLRYIYDGLIKGSIHPENAAELPEGLIGLYEEAFDERTSVMDRQQLLERFAIWALLKKEVSAQFVAEVLNQPEEEIQEFIAAYSAWFNSPESGKYQLYHERLKVYLLQKLSQGEVHVLHEKLISRLEQAIEEQKADEFEWYGLEFLTSHYAINAMLSGDGSKLLTIAYDQNHWQRQLKISKGYIWTKSGLHSVMNWASKYNDDEVIECGLQLVDLHHQEQNAAPQIVALVAEGDFDAALKRIEQFGGKNLIGIQRRFSLYMLCLLELTFSKNIKGFFRKIGFEKIFKHLDEKLEVSEQMLIDQPSLDWVNYFPIELVHIISIESTDLDVDCSTIYNRTIDYKYLNKRIKSISNISMIDKKNNYSSQDINIEIGIAIKIEFDTQRNYEIRRIFKILLVNKKFKKAKKLLTLIDDDILRQISLFEYDITRRLQNRIEEEELDTLFKTLMNLFKDESVINKYLYIFISLLVKLNLKSKIPLVLKLESRVHIHQWYHLPMAARELLSESNFEGASFLINLYFDFVSLGRFFSMNLMVEANSIPFFKTSILRFISPDNEFDYNEILQICLKELSNKEFNEKSIDNINYVNSQYHNNEIFSLITNQLFTYKKYKKIKELFEETKNDELKVMILSRISTRLFLMNKPNLCQKMISIAIQMLNDSQESESDKGYYCEFIFAELILQNDSNRIFNIIESSSGLYKQYVHRAIRSLERMNKLSSNNISLKELVDKIEKNSILCDILLKISFLAHKETSFSAEKEYYERFLIVSNLIKEENRKDIIKMLHSAYLISTKRSIEGLQISQSIRDPNDKLSVWRKVGAMYSQLYNLGTALEFSKNIVDIDCRYRFLGGILQNIDFVNEPSKTINLLFYLTYENPTLLHKVLTSIHYSNFFSNRNYKEIDFRLAIKNNQWANKIKNQINYKT